MNNKKLHYFKEKLLEDKKKQLKVLNNMSNMEEYGSMNLYHNELSNYDNHPADIGTELFMMEQDNGFKNKIKDTLYEINESLINIDEGSYGICKECNKQIMEERLDLIPYLKTCLKCGSNSNTPTEESQVSRQFIPIVEEDGTSFSDTKEDMVMFDREDSYQKVATFNYIDDDPSHHTGDYQGVMDEQDNDEGDGVEEVEKISQEYYNKTLK